MSGTESVNVKPERVSAIVSIAGETDHDVPAFTVGPSDGLDGIQVHVYFTVFGSIFVSQNVALDLAEQLRDCVGEIRREEGGLAEHPAASILRELEATGSVIRIGNNEEEAKC